MSNIIPEKMNAIKIVGESGPAASLVINSVEVPIAKETEILIKVYAAGVNRPDIFQREGKYPAPVGASKILGLEVSGVVVKASGRWKVGDRVCALLAGGGYAEYAVCDARHALPIPKGMSFTEAAALPETIFTVFANVFVLGQLKKGETFLVHGANSGIGVTAIQMAKAAGAYVIATARGVKKTKKAVELGADLAVDVTKSDFVEKAKQSGGVDVVLEMMGGEYFDKDIQAIKIGGRIVFIAALAGRDIKLPLMAIMQKRVSITGSTLRPRSVDEKADLAVAIEQTVWPWLKSKKVIQIVDKVYPLGKASEAHKYLESGTHIGKVVLTTNKKE